MKIFSNNIFLRILIGALTLSLWANSFLNSAIQDQEIYIESLEEDYHELMGDYIGSSVLQIGAQTCSFWLKEDKSYYNLDEKTCLWFMDKSWQAQLKFLEFYNENFWSLEDALDEAKKHILD